MEAKRDKNNKGKVSSGGQSGEHERPLSGDRKSINDPQNKQNSEERMPPPRTLYFLAGKNENVPWA